MNFGNLKYKSLLLGVGASMLMATSCKDFLDVDIYDNYSPSTLTSKSAYQSLTTTLYGGYKWFQYESKFSWCVNEGIPGVLFNINDQEGALFKLSIGEDNPILKEGYTSLYSGVIAHANAVIKTVESASVPSDMTRAEMDAVLGEAKLFRAYAHFLATEYFGEAPLVLNTETDISGNVSLPVVSRRTLYAAIEKDLLEAYSLLPESNTTDTWRATKYSASALLAKLYLTMASCQSAAAGAGLTFPYICDNPTLYLESAKNYLNEIINSGKYSLEPHKTIFSAENRDVPTSETIFALYWRSGAYGEGSAYQSQIAMSSDWSPGSGWGSGKGLTYTLYNSFDDNDARKKELCFFVGKGSGNGYTTYDGRVGWYGSSYNDMKKAGTAQFGMTGKDFLAQGQHLFNNVKKYVWGIDGTATHSSGMSIDRRQDIIRYSDVYMMLAEIALLEGGDVTAANATAADYVNTVLTAHGAPTIDSLSYFEDLSAAHQSYEAFVFNVTVEAENGGSAQKTVTVKASDCGATAMYHKAKRSDYLQQRRKEFAMEGSAWLDLKRFYYYSPENAYKFMQQIDRSCSMTNSPELSGSEDPQLENEIGYDRLAVVNAVNTALKNDPTIPNASTTYSVGDSEVGVFTEDFNNNNRWYLPIPASAKAYLKGAQDLYDQVKAGTYPY